MEGHRHYLPRRFKDFKADYGTSVSLAVLNAATQMQQKRKNPNILILAFLLGGSIKSIKSGMDLLLRNVEGRYRILLDSKEIIILNEYERLLYGILFENWTVWEKRFRISEAQFRHKVWNDSRQYLSSQIKVNGGWGVATMRNLYILHLFENDFSQEQVRVLLHLGSWDYWFDHPPEKEVMAQIGSRGLPIRF